jgi:2-hydroxychromene-2-carboxylate isomerase
VPHLDFHFDLSSPWTRLAFHNVQPILAETNATVTWRPFLVGGVFNAVNPSVYEGRANPDAPKNRHTGKWLIAWARLAGVPMNFPSPHHPVKSVHAMRLCCALEPDQPALFAFAEAAFDAYFARQENLDDPAVLAAIADGVGLDGQALVARTRDDDVRQRLRDNTQAVIDLGGFGSPTMIVGGDLFFGNDQLPLVRQALRAQNASRRG